MTFYRRNLPHWQPEGMSIFLTWRLFGSLPRKPRGQEPPGCPSSARAENSGTTDWGRKFVALDRSLDIARSGPLWLADPKIADCAECAILRGADLKHYELHAFAVMPNHVHILLDPRLPLGRITNSIKGVAARDANAVLGRTGKPFWQDESFDHWVRGAAEFERIRRYIEWNPVKAKLAARPEDWKWSSAHPGFGKLAEKRTARSGCATENEA